MPVTASAVGIGSREGSPEIDGAFSSDGCGGSSEEEGELPPSEEGELQPSEEGGGRSVGRQPEEAGRSEERRPSEEGVGGSAVQQPSEGGVGRSAVPQPEGPEDPRCPPAFTSALPPVPPWGPYLQRERGWVRITGIVRRGGIRRWGRSPHFTPSPH